MNLIGRARLARSAGIHLTFVLLASCTVYGVRDIWPLMTYTLQPLDIQEGVLLWVKIALLVMSGVVVPLVSPRQYTPADPQVCYAQLTNCKQSNTSPEPL